MAKKGPKGSPAPSPQELIERAVVNFCAENNVDGSALVEALAQTDNTEEALGLIQTFFEENGVAPDPLFIELSAAVAALPRKSVTSTHMSIVEEILLTRASVLEKGTRTPNHVAFALARFASDNLRAMLLHRIGTSPDFPSAISRAVSLAPLCLRGFSEAPEGYLQERLRNIPQDQSFLREIYEEMFKELREDIEWRAGAAVALDGILTEEQLKILRESVSPAENFEEIPSQRFCLYRILVKFWLPQVGITNPVAFLNERDITNPQAEMAHLL